MKFNLIILLLLSISISTVSAQKSFRIIEGNDYSGVVIPSEAPFPFFIAEGRFTPESDLVAKAEKELSKNLSLIFNKEDNCGIEGYKSLIGYKRQYFGYTENGQNILFISFIKIQDNIWKRGIIITEGGGCNYFQLKYDPASNRLFDLHVNTIE